MRPIQWVFRWTAIGILGLSLLGSMLFSAFPSTPQAGFAAPNATNTPFPTDLSAPPPVPVKLMFIHAETGSQLLGNYSGGLAESLQAQNYFISDIDQRWAYTDTANIKHDMGSHTDVGELWSWFRSPTNSYSSTAMASLYSKFTSEGNFYKTIQDPNPTKPNEVFLILSEYRNSVINGNPNDPPTPINVNPLRNQSALYNTVGDVKGLYVDMLEYFRQHPESMFVLLTTGPSNPASTSPGGVTAQQAANSRAIANWLMDKQNGWLKGYLPNGGKVSNVYVYDYFNVMTSNGGDYNTNDLGSPTGNHHRWDPNGHLEVHSQTVMTDTSAYLTPKLGAPGQYIASPSTAGMLKMAAEFAPMLNVFYRTWKNNQTNQGGTPVPTLPVQTFTPTPTATATPRPGQNWTVTDQTYLPAVKK